MEHWGSSDSGDYVSDKDLKGVLKGGRLFGDESFESRDLG